jgi:thymidylate synthase (FAD)
MDAMTVRLICASAPVVAEIPGIEELLAYFARVSSTANQLNHATGPKLIASLIRRKEWSPLEMVSLTMEIVTTRDIARQILRHRSFSFQEFSQRYAKVEDEPVFREARLQDHQDRQNSIETDDDGLADKWAQRQRVAAIAARQAYDWALENGIAKEVARAVLPEGMTPSRLYMAGTLRSWVHYCLLRADRKTQKEHRVIAEACRDIIIAQFPSLSGTEVNLTFEEAKS